MKQTKLQVTWTGIRPLIMHNATMADPDNPHVQERDRLKRAGKKLKKDDEDGKAANRREIEKAEWLGAVYWDEKVGFYVPGQNVFRCITEGAKSLKAGKRAEAGLLPLDEVIPIQTVEYPMDLDAVYEMGTFCFRHVVRIPPRTGSRVMIVRPIIPTGWTITFEMEFDGQHLPKEDAIEANKYAGSIIGIGIWRPRFGRFLVEIE